MALFTRTYFKNNPIQLMKLNDAVKMVKKEQQLNDTAFLEQVIRDKLGLTSGQYDSFDCQYLYHSMLDIYRRKRSALLNSNIYVAIAAYNLLIQNEISAEAAAFDQLGEIKVHKIVDGLVGGSLNVIPQMYVAYRKICQDEKYKRAEAVVREYYETITNCQKDMVKKLVYEHLISSNDLEDLSDYLQQNSLEDYSRQLLLGCKQSRKLWFLGDKPRLKFEKKRFDSASWN